MAAMSWSTSTLSMTPDSTPLFMTPDTPHLPPTQDPVQVVGVDTVIIGILGVCGVGVFIALGIFICRSWMSRPSFRHIDSAIYKPCIQGTHEVKRKRHLDQYSKVRLSTPIILPPPTREVPEYYYSDIMHTDDATIICVCTNDDQEVDANNNVSENPAPAILPTNEDTRSTDELTFEDHCRPE